MKTLKEIKDVKVEVYYNFHLQLWSVRDRKTRRVIGHAENVCLSHCTFKVSQAGRERVLREGRKNVHAFVQGNLRNDLLVSDSFDPLRSAKRIGYNPYRVDNFCYLDKSGIPDASQPIESAKLVTLIAVHRSVWARA
jgi:hypothetical protein